jgi:hypothetical protein
MITSDELLKIAETGARKVEVSRDMRRYPNFSDVEDTADTEYEQLLEALHDDELFAPVDLERQEQLVELVKRGLPEDRWELLDELIDNLSRQVWLHQEAAYHLGMAVGFRIAEVKGQRPAATRREDVH